MALTQSVDVTHNAISENQSWQLPSDSWDTHVHVFSPLTHAYSSSRAYTPRASLLKQYLGFNLSLTSCPNGKRNLVLVQPSPYGQDNSLILSLLRAHHEQKLFNGTFRAIVVLDAESTTREELKEMDRLGVRGVRINVEASGHATSASTLRQAVIDTAQIIKEAGLENKWYIQLFIGGGLWDDMAEVIKDLGVRVIADHLGGLKGTSCLPTGTDILTQPGFATLLSLAKSHHVVIKISGLYRLSNSVATTYADLEPLVKQFVQAVPEQLIWASDFPHTGKGEDRKGRGVDVPESFQIIDDVRILKLLRSRVPAQVWQDIMVTNPERIYA